MATQSSGNATMPKKVATAFEEAPVGAVLPAEYEQYAVEKPADIDDIAKEANGTVVLVKSKDNTVVYTIQATLEDGTVKLLSSSEVSKLRYAGESLNDHFNRVMKNRFPSMISAIKNAAMCFNKQKYAHTDEQTRKMKQIALPAFTEFLSGLLGHAVILKLESADVESEEALDDIFS